MESQTAIAVGSVKGGRVAVAPRRHISRISELYDQEHNELSDLVTQIRRQLGGDNGANGIDTQEWVEDGNVQHAYVQLVRNSKDLDNEGIKTQLTEARRDYVELGGWRAFKSGEWLLPLVQKSFQNYWERANTEYFQKKYGTQDNARIAKKLVKVAARNSALLGAVIGLTVSADEALAIVTGAEGGVGLPANIAIALVAIGSEMILLTRFQLQLIAELGKLYGVPLDPNDPEDILTILGFAIGCVTGERAGTFATEAGGEAAGLGAKRIFRGAVLRETKRIFAKMGVKILQGSIVKYTIPGASIVIGGGWNYAQTKIVAKIAQRHFRGLGGKL
ncbi:MAG: hypothetical protein ACR2JB_15845 [Bryobacteraceae bacterium]